MKSFFLTICLILISWNAFANPSIEFSKKAYSSLTNLDATQNEFSQKSTQIFQTFFDFNKFSNRVFYDIIKKSDQNDLNKFKSAFKKLFLLNFSKKSLKLFKNRIKDPIYNIKKAIDKFTIVEMTGKTSENKNLKLAFYISNQKTPSIIDIAFDDILLSRNYRGSFNKIYRQEGSTGLIKRIENATQKLKSAK